MSRRTWWFFVPGVLAVLYAGRTSLALPPDNPRERRLIESSALYVVALSAAPLVFQQLGGESTGLAFCSLILVLHLLALSGKRVEPEIAQQHVLEMRTSAATMTGILTTFAFLIAGLRSEKTFYHQSNKNAQAWMISLLFGLIFMIPEVPFEPSSTAATLVRHTQSIMLSYSLGFFVSGVVLGRSA